MDEKPTTHEAYEQIADRYAEVAKSKPHNVYLERPAIRALVPNIQGGKVLDAGCGPGTNIHWLIERGARKVVGIDASPKMIEIAGRETVPTMSLHVANMSQPLDFLATGSFDLVFSSLVVHYIEDIGALFAEIARLLRPGGWLVFSTHHPQADCRHHPGDYFKTVFVSENWRGFGDEPVTVSFYRRPLSAITEALANATFVIERLTEAQPTADYRRADPVRYENASQHPSFLCVRARRR
jgi:SAM-dependent methyltransferase